MASDDKISLVGVWKLVSWVTEDVETLERRALFGEHPTGYIVFTESGRAIAILTGDRRKVPKSDEDKVGAFGSMVAYSGKYEIEGNRLTTRVDIAWDEAQVGTDQVRFFRIEGDNLAIETAPFVSPKFGGKLVRSFLVWRRES